MRRRELGARLRTLRTAAGLTVEEVAGQLLCSPSKVSRIETGSRGATPRDVRDLCDLYGVTDPVQRDLMMELSREGKQQGWWQTYDLPYAKYVGLEAEALSIRGFQSSVVPGLLQTREYARAMHEGSAPRLSDDVIELRVEARLIRQQLLEKEPVPRFWEVLDEAALHRLVGGADVMRKQLDRLIEACQLPAVTVQVVPFAVGAHPALESNFKILELRPPAPGVVYVEGLTGSSYLERPEDMHHFEQVFSQLTEMALDPPDTIHYISEIRDSLGLRPTRDLWLDEG
jgi:transcriptional regulator with XRE-family HTH domain